MSTDSAAPRSSASLERTALAVVVGVLLTVRLSAGRLEAFSLSLLALATLAALVAVGAAPTGRGSCGRVVRLALLTGAIVALGVAGIILTGPDLIPSGAEVDR